ncbi:hypothetical protein PQG75_06450 [Corynebacterium pseudodiphtheriticum]|uniref:hypothetical protein n=1 Tax=Corynebacterium pseudodiphtheriticum TaxID=37637 RepID=UPI00234C950C|nr:hypothetical protein [Corynebacterium pseudodiphtheriticum]MDC7112998.1 hypothetical protein [Corynebacterium pseudodiphtheriticum]
MADQSDAGATLTALQGVLTGAEPPSDSMNRIGGWDSIQIVAPELVDDPLLMPVTALAARDAAAETGGPDTESMRRAVEALATAVLDTEDPGLFASTVDFFCTDAAISEIAGDLLAARCLTLAVPPTSEQGGLHQASVLRRATALEAAAQLAVRGRGSKHKLLALLEDITEPQPRRYAQAVMRTVALAFDHWTPDEETADVIDVLTGVAVPRHNQPPTEEVVERNEVFRRDAAPDAAWTLANIALAKALRLTAVTDMCKELDTAVENLSFVANLDDRDDACLLKPALELLRKLLSALPATTAPYDAAAWAPDLDEAKAIAARADEFTFDRRGLNHWSGDRKTAVLRGWSRFAEDLAFLGDQLSRDSIYDASIVLDDISAIYSSSRSYELTHSAGGSQNVVTVLRPAIGSGFAARAGLLRNLTDHTDALRGKLEAASAGGDSANKADLQGRLTTAEHVLEAARISLVAAPEPPGKSHTQVAALPPLLADFFASTPAVADALKGVPQEQLERLTGGIADRQAAIDPDPDLMVTATRKRMIEALTRAEDFRGDVVPAVTAVLDQLIKFVRQRINSQQSWNSYLFDPEADEQDLHADLYDWLNQGQLGSATNVEVQEVGGGRADIQIQFSGFHLYLELKADHTAVPVADKSTYIKQTVSYQASDVRIGFLIVLRMTPPKDKSPSAHLTEYVSHTTVPVNGGAIERHVVMLEVPGNQTKPSRVR